MSNALNLNQYFKSADVMRLLENTGRVIMTIRDEAAQNPEYKNGEEIVSFADRKSQENIQNGLRHIFSNAVFVAEESSEQDIRQSIMDARTADWTWVIDPIDGTRNYMAGDDNFAIQVALAHQGRIVGAWIHCPSTGKSVYSSIGQDMNALGLDYVNREVPNDISGLNIVLASGDFDEDHKTRADNLVTQTAYSRGTRSCAVDYLEVIEGHMDLLIYRRTLPWDHAPGAFLVQQANGKIERFDGQDYRPFDNQEGMIVSRKPTLRHISEQFTP